MKSLVVCELIAFMYALERYYGEDMVIEDDSYYVGSEMILMPGIVGHINFDQGWGFDKMMGFNERFMKYVNDENVYRVIWLMHSSEDITWINEYRKYIGKIPVKEYTAVGKTKPRCIGVEMVDLVELSPIMSGLDHSEE